MQRNFWKLTNTTQVLRERRSRQNTKRSGVAFASIRVQRTELNSAKHSAVDTLEVLCSRTVLPLLSALGAELALPDAVAYLNFCYFFNLI